MASLYVISRAGSPIDPGSKLFFYQTGTSMPQDTYSQSDLAIGHVNTNPVVADSNGLFGPIYLLATPDYKVVMQDSLGNTIWTTDPILTAAVSVITTEGDLIVGNNVGVAVRLPIGSAAEYLRSDGTTASWHTLDAADLVGGTPRANMPPGSVIQSVLTTTNVFSSHTTSLPADDTIPQITEGDLLLTASITPTSTSTRVRASALVWVDGGASSTAAGAALFRGAVADALAAGVFFSVSDSMQPLSLEFEDVPGSVSAQSYTLRVGPNSGTVYINGSSGGRFFGGVAVSSLRLEEIAV